MAHTERDASREPERHVRHQHSASTDQRSRALVPMWDSSDPERAPPPLPLNPQSPKLTSRSGTSSAIQSAHAALNERARESANASSNTAKRNEGSPERALAKGAAHRRMQSLQPASVKDLGWMIENPQPSSRPATPNDTQSPQKESTPTPGPSLTPIVRPTARRLDTQSILGENTPPHSSTMLALQSMSSQSSLKEGEANQAPPLTNVTNGSTPAPQNTVEAHSMEGLSAQLVSLTSIANALRKEMSALSRRSRDNATDLLSLKEATNTRDEDIRRSIRDLVGQVNDQNQRLSLSSLNNILDNKPFPASPPSRHSVQLPRIPPPRAFADAIDRESVSTPSLTGPDASASIALLEKILRGLGTGEGEVNLVSLLNQLSSKLSGMATSSKVDDLVQFVRSQSESAIVPAGGSKERSASFGQSSNGMELDRPRSGPMTQRVEHLLQNAESRRSSAPPGRGAELLNEDLMNIIHSVKDSIAQGGGLTAEVKAMVRELRGEVLGMGRELAKRLEDMGPQSTEDEDTSIRKDEVSRVIDHGLEQMKEQLNHVLREHRRQSAASSSSQRTVVDYQEIYNAMRAALRDNEASRGDMPDLNRDDVIEAVREAWENYKPEIDVEKLGLEREEIMACLKEGLQDYQPEEERPAGATREEVFTAVVEGLKHFVPPQMDNAASLSRDEIIEAVRDCLEEFEFPVSAAAVGNDMSHKDMVHAVKEGLSDLDMHNGGALSSESNGEIMSRLQDIMEYMKLEFRAVSEEAKDNVAANGRDTEQVLDATKDGLENLRIAIESYVDRTSDPASNANSQEFMDGLLKTMDEFKEDIGRIVSDASATSKEHLQTEFDGIREMVNTSMVPATPQGSNKEVLEALQTGLNGLRQDMHRPRPETSEILDAINDGLNEIRTGIDRITNKPVDLTANDEILDALKSGLDGVRSDIETLRENNNEQALSAVPKAEESPADKAVIPVDAAKQDDIKNLEVLITQLRIKVEAMAPETESVHKEDIVRLEDMLRGLQEGVDGISARETTSARSVGEDGAEASGDAATRDDIQAVETILRNTKDRLDDLIDGEQAVRKEHVDSLVEMMSEHKEFLGSMSGQMDGVSRKDDVSSLEEIMAQVIISLDELKDNSQKDAENGATASKEDVEAVEARVLEIKTALEGFSDVDFAAVSRKDDVSNIENLVKEAKEKLDEYAETSTKALNERQEEIVGVGERVAEVKTFLEEFQEAVQTKLEDGATGVEGLGNLLETMGEKIGKNENVGDDLKEMFDTMKAEFELSKEVVAGARMESDEKLQEATDGIATKIEEKIGELIAKYDEFQETLDEKAKAGDERNVEIEAAVVSTKAVSEELKLLVDTLGSTVTDSLEKMEEASKTVFEKVEELASRTGETEEGEKSQHQQTRDQILAAVSAVEGVQGELKDYQPQILEAVKDILMLVGQHYEHSKSTATDIQDRIIEAKPAEQEMLLPPEKYDDSEVKEKLNQLAEQKYDDSEIRERLDKLAEQQGDHTAIHDKLDKLTEHSASTVAAFAQLETLDKVHKTAVETAAQMSEFLNSQTQRITDEHDDREKTLQETSLAVERKLAEKDHVEAAVLSLHTEEDRLQQSVLNLRTEQESLIRQKTRLTGDVSSLETALRLRREELADMEARAERLERRIVEGVMDHSRVLLMGKSSKDGGCDNMNRKRVKKPAVTDSEVKSSPRPAVNMALSTRRSLAPTTQNGAARRIASLSQMNNGTSPSAVKRSQSVRTPAGGPNTLRKRSWGGGLAKSFGVEDKENISEAPEEDEESDAGKARRDLFLKGRSSYSGTEMSSMLESGGEDDDHSDAETMRRSSRGTTIVSGTDLYTESEAGYSEYDDTASEWTASATGTRSSLGTVAGNEIALPEGGQ